MPQRGIHAALDTSCMPPSLGSNTHHSPSDSTSSINVTASAMRFAVRSSPSSTGTTPASGSSTRTWSIHWLYPIVSRNWLMSVSPDHRMQDPQRSDQEQHDIDTDLTGLQPTPQPAQATGELGGAIYCRAIYDPLVHTLPEEEAGHPDQRA